MMDTFDNTSTDSEDASLDASDVDAAVEEISEGVELDDAETAALEEAGVDASENFLDAYPLPSRPDGYYSESNSDGSRFSQFIDKDGDITAERPHVHVIHNEHEGQIIGVATQEDGSHTDTQYLSIDASGNEVNDMVDQMRKGLE